VFTPLAHAVIRLRWLFIAAWAVLAVVAFTRAPGTPALLNLRGGTDRPTEARAVETRIAERFSSPIRDFFAVVVTGPGSFRSGRAQAALDSLTEATRRAEFVRAVITHETGGDATFLSTDERQTFFLVALDTPTPDSAGGLVEPMRRVLREAFNRLPERDLYSVTVTGRSALDLDIRTVSAEDAKRLELNLLPLTLVILLLAFGALVAALIPLIIGMVVIAVSLTIIGVLATMTPMSVFVLNLTTMIGLGVGIDYSLLVVTRFREELTRGVRRKEAALRTLKTAGVAVITSGTTVAVGFGALLITPLVETRSIGIGGLVVVAVAVLMCVTFLPALLATMGRSIDRPRWLAKRLAWYHSPQIWEKWARTLSRHPRRAMILGLTTIAVLTAPLMWIRIDLPARGWWPTATEAGRGVQALADLGAVGVILPIRVLVDVPEGERATAALRLRGLRALSDTLRADPRVADVRSIVDLEPGTSILGYSLLYGDLTTAREQYPDFLGAYLSEEGGTTLMDVVLADTTSLTTGTDVVRDLRALIAADTIRGLRGATVQVGGYIASSVDSQELLLEQFPLLILLVLSVTGLMLAIAFRSILVPLKAVVMNSLAVGATFGLIVLVFQRGAGVRVFGLDGATEAIFVVVPVVVFAVVFGLSMDYEVFMLSRIKEAYDRTGKNTEATMEGLSATASVITSAALIMILVFGAFGFAKVLMMQFVGFGLAVAVFLDATIVRMVLVPAFMQLMGRWNWWPGVRSEQGKAGSP
jgi:putative drug exporter of the RND superfamily